METHIKRLPDDTDEAFSSTKLSRMVFIKTLMLLTEYFDHVEFCGNAVDIRC